MPIFQFYPETAFGGDFRTEAAYRDPEVQCLIRTGGLDACFDDPEGLMQQVDEGTMQEGDFQKGWTIWPPIPYSFNTPVDRPGAAPLPLLPRPLRARRIDAPDHLNHLHQRHGIEEVETGHSITTIQVSGN